MPQAPATLRDLLIARVASDPARLAFDDGRRSVTYGELAERAAGQAARLTALGVGPGDRVALAMPAGVAFAEAFWAAQLLGATAAAFSPDAPPSQLERRIARVRPRIVAREGLLEDAPPAATLPEDAGSGPEAVAILQPTSGTSGEPRAAMVTHRNVLAYLCAEGPERATRDDVLVSWVPPWHDLGLVRFVAGAVGYGAPCHIVQPAIRTIPLWLETISRTRGTMTGAPDFAYRLATRMVDPVTVDLSSLRFATNGGEPVRRSTIERFEERFGISGVVLPGYGLAEATLGVASHRAGEPLAVDERGNVSCGRVRQGMEVRTSGQRGAGGEILLRGDTVFAGYFDAPDDTAATLRDGWLHTGDIGHVDEHGRLFVLGRRRAMIKRGGVVVSPRELEEAAQDVPGVRVAAAVEMPRAAGVTETAVVAVEHESAGTAGAEALAAEVSRSVAAAAGFAPGRVAVLPPRMIPRTANGKVRHDRLRELLLTELSPSAAGEVVRG